MTTWNVLIGDAIEQLRTLPAGSVQTCVTSPPYWGLRSYLPEGDPAKAHELGAEQTPDEYVANMVAVFREVWRVLRDDGTLWLNLGDSYNGSGGAGGDYGPGGLKEGQPKYAGRNVGSLKPKDLVGIPWRVAFAFQADGWYLRSDIIWHKPNPMPESVTDRPAKAHEYLFLLTKSARYYYDAEAIKKPSTGQTGAAANFQRETKEAIVPRQGYLQHRNGRTPTEDSGTRNKRSVWTVSTKPYRGSHYAVFPPDLIEPCILAGSAVGDTVLDPFVGSGTTLQVAIKHNRNAIGIDLDARNAELINKRMSAIQPVLIAL